MPKCGSLEPFVIGALAEFEVYDDGTESFENVEWCDSSSCYCRNCDYQGTVGYFKYHRYAVHVERIVHQRVVHFVDATSQQYANYTVLTMLKNSEEAEALEWENVEEPEIGSYHSARMSDSEEEECCSKEVT